MKKIILAGILAMSSSMTYAERKFDDVPTINFDCYDAVVTQRTLSSIHARPLFVAPVQMPGWDKVETWITASDDVMIFLHNVERDTYCLIVEAESLQYYNKTIELIDRAINKPASPWKEDPWKDLQNRR